MGTLKLSESKQLDAKTPKTSLSNKSGKKAGKKKKSRSSVKSSSKSPIRKWKQRKTAKPRATPNNSWGRFVSTGDENELGGSKKSAKHKKKSKSNDQIVKA